GVRRYFVAGFQWLDAKRMGSHFRLEQFLRPSGALDMIRIGMRRDNHLARRQAEVHLADQFDNFFDRVNKADVNKDELVASIDEINIHTKPAAGLVVHFDDIRKDVLPFQHAWRNSQLPPLPERPARQAGLTHRWMAARVLGYDRE